MMVQRRSKNDANRAQEKQVEQGYKTIWYYWFWTPKGDVKGEENGVVANLR
jgi:hypothetical protein